MIQNNVLKWNFSSWYQDKYTFHMHRIPLFLLPYSLKPKGVVFNTEGAFVSVYSVRPCQGWYSHMDYRSDIHI